MSEIIKTTLKLLFRNVGFWFFMITMPVLATFILNIHQDYNAYYVDDDIAKVVELDDIDSKVAYYGKDGRFVVKVYDASGSRLADHMLKDISEAGMFEVCRVKADGMTKEEADKRSEIDGQNDRMGAYFYIGSGFDKDAVSGDTSDSLIIYVMSDDERYDLLEDKVKKNIAKISSVAESMGTDDAAAITDYLEEASSHMPKKNVVTFKAKNGVDLTEDQINKRTNLGYAFSFLTLGFVFCGILVAHGVIKEQNNDVLTRIKLTGKSNGTYFAAKFIVGIIISVILSSILSICTLFVDSSEMGMSRPELLCVVFLMGIIFCSLSLLLGILIGNVMGANIAAFALWSMSSMLSGLYFPLEDTSKGVKILSYMMPQKWFVDGSEKLFVGDNNAWIMLLCVTAAFLVIILGLGTVGIKMRTGDE